MYYGVMITDSEKPRIGYFINLKDAEKYCAVYNPYFNSGIVYEVECIQDSEDLSAVNITYRYIVEFERRNQNERYEKCRTEVHYHEGTNLRPNFVKRGYSITIGADSINIEVNLSERNQQLAEKIAQNALVEMMIDGNGTIGKEQIAKMNERFKQQRKQENESKGG